MKFSVSCDGLIRFLYQEEMDLSGLGPQSVVRVSDVEPVEDGWIAFVRNGPYLGPYSRRSEALKAEVEWIEENIL